MSCFSLRITGDEKCLYSEISLSMTRGVRCKVASGKHA